MQNKTVDVQPLSILRNAAYCVNRPYKMCNDSELADKENSCGEGLEINDRTGNPKIFYL